jgi:hypothetical protein
MTIDKKDVLQRLAGVECADERQRLASVNWLTIDKGLPFEGATVIMFVVGRDKEWPT